MSRIHQCRRRSRGATDDQPTLFAREGGDRLLRLYHQLVSELPEWIPGLVDAKMLVVGKIGVTAPADAHATELFSDGNVATHVTSGYIRLFDAVATDLASTMSLGADGAAAASPIQAAAHTASRRSPKR